MKYLRIHIVVLLLVCLFTPLVNAEQQAEEAWLAKAEGGAAKRAADAVAKFKSKRAAINKYFNESYGYAIFPSVGRGGVYLGIAYGRGLVVEQGRLVGKTSFWQFMYGVLFGGEYYSEIIFFKDKKTLDMYKQGRMEFVGQAGVSLLTLGGAATPAFNSGVAIFTMTRLGLMIEVTPSGAMYSFKPFSENVDTASR